MRSEAAAQHVACLHRLHSLNRLAPTCCTCTEHTYPPSSPSHSALLGVASNVPPCSTPVLPNNFSEHKPAKLQTVHAVSPTSRLTGIGLLPHGEGYFSVHTLLINDTSKIAHTIQTNLQTISGLLRHCRAALRSCRRRNLFALGQYPAVKRHTLCLLKPTKLTPVISNSETTCLPLALLQRLQRTLVCPVVRPTRSTCALRYQYLFVSTILFCRTKGAKYHITCDLQSSCDSVLTVLRVLCVYVRVGRHAHSRRTETHNPRPATHPSSILTHHSTSVRNAFPHPTAAQAWPPPANAQQNPLQWLPNPNHSPKHRPHLPNPNRHPTPTTPLKSSSTPKSQNPN